MTGIEIADYISNHRFRFSTEHDLQDHLQTLFELGSIDFFREVPLGKDRIDFMHAGVGIEVKIKSSTSQVIRQLYRYAEHEIVKELVLVTTRSKHHRMPENILGKRVTLCSLAMGGL